jgi:hypothetical protein
MVGTTPPELGTNKPMPSKSPKDTALAILSALYWLAGWLFLKYYGTK